MGTNPSMRFIPTGVGNTEVMGAEDMLKAVHPHWCGEHFNKYVHRKIIHGSSPLVWGTHW